MNSQHGNAIHSSVSKIIKHMIDNGDDKPTDTCNKHDLEIQR